MTQLAHRGVGEVFVALVTAALAAIPASGQETTRPEGLRTRTGERPGNVEPGRLEDLTYADGRLTLTLTGQVSDVILGYDDGTATYAPSDALTLGFVYEANYALNAGFLMTQDDPWVSPEGLEHRQLEMTLFHDRLGKVSLGQGFLAGDAITQLDLSGTAFVGHNSIGDHGGAFTLREAATGEPSSLTVAEIMSDLDGNKTVRVCYDTPSLAGFTLSGSYSGGSTLDPFGPAFEATDVTLRYQSPDGPTPFGNPAIREVQAAIGHLVNDGAPDQEVVAGSASILMESRWNATLRSSPTAATPTARSAGAARSSVSGRRRCPPISTSARRRPRASITCMRWASRPRRRSTVRRSRGSSAYGASGARDRSISRTSPSGWAGSWSGSECFAKGKVFTVLGGRQSPSPGALRRRRRLARPHDGLEETLVWLDHAV